MHKSKPYKEPLLPSRLYAHCLSQEHPISSSQRGNLLKPKGSCPQTSTLLECIASCIVRKSCHDASNGEVVLNVPKFLRASEQKVTKATSESPSQLRKLQADSENKLEHSGNVLLAQAWHSTSVHKQPVSANAHKPQRSSTIRLFNTRSWMLHWRIDWVPILSQKVWRALYDW